MEEYNATNLCRGHRNNLLIVHDSCPWKLQKRCDAGLQTPAVALEITQVRGENFTEVAPQTPGRKVVALSEKAA